jgi:HemY protein
MRKLIYYFIILLLAVWIGLKIAADPGYLLVAYHKTTVEMPLWLAVVGILILFFILYITLRIISNILSLGARIRAWSRTRRVRRAWMRTHRGLIELAAGEWKQAEKDLIRAASNTNTPIINYIGAARAAQSDGAILRRDEYLGKIQVKGKLLELARGLTQAQLQLRQHQYEQALATLQQLQQIAPKHNPILQLLKQTYLHLEDWGSLEILLPRLEKYGVLRGSQLEKLQLKIYEGLLKSAGEGISLVWSRVPKYLRQSAVLLNIYIPSLSKKDSDEAEELLRSALQKHLNAVLLNHYGLIESTHKEKQLQIAEGFLKEHPKNAALLLTLGRLCVKNELWGKARSYFEASIGFSHRSETYQELGKLLERLGDQQKAMEYYRSGLALVNEQ